MIAFHTTFGWVAVAVLGLTGLWGLGLAIRRAKPGRAYHMAMAISIAAVLIQITVGTWLLTVDEIDPGNQHVFYGVVIAATLALAYVYRGQLRRRPALYYAVLMLFVMGLGIRAITTFGKNF